VVQAQRPRASAPPTTQLVLPLELSEALESRARLPASSVAPPPTVLAYQVWGTLPLAEQRRAQQVFVQVIQEVLRNGDRD